MRAQDEAAIVACITGLRSYARGLVSDATRADDLVQDTLERAWSRFSIWQKRGDIRAWMFGIMHNHFIDGVRARGRRLGTASATTCPKCRSAPASPTASKCAILTVPCSGCPPNNAK